MAPPPDAAAPRALERGDAVGRFVLIGLLGRGGMGEVYAAYDPELDRKVAVKILRARSADGEARLLREAQAIAKLSHPNVVVVYDVGKHGDTVFIAMEFVDGSTLGVWMHAEPRPWRETLRVFALAGRGLAAAHELGMVHRDFKPENVMLTKDGQVRVMDFGLARQVGEAEGATAPPMAPAAPPAAIDLDATMPLTGLAARVPPPGRASSPGYLSVKLTQTGAQMGTPAYMAPEQFAAVPTDARTDQFSFCVALYEALYGQRPFAGDTMLALTTNVTQGILRPPPAAARVPGWIRRVLLRGLATEPPARFPSMGALLAALEKDPAIRRRRTATVALALVVAGGIAVAASRAGSTARSLCAGGGARLAGIWEGPGELSPRKDELRAAFLATGKGYAGPTFTATARLLDQWAERWMSMYRDACEATQMRGEQSADVLDLRMSCLSDRLANLRALTDVFAKADDGVVQNAVSAAGALPPLDGCADVAALRAVVKPPSDPATLKRVGELREELARVLALRDSGQCAGAEARGAPLADAVRATKYAPLVGETLTNVGELGHYCGDAKQAVARLKEGFGAALAGRLDGVAIEAASSVVALAGMRLGDAETAREWQAIAAALLARVGRNGRLEGFVLTSEGVRRGAIGDLEGHITKAREAHAATAGALGPDHPWAINGLVNIGDALAAAGHAEQAVAIDRQGLAAAERVFGQVNSVVASLNNNIAEALNLLGRWSEARAASERALAIWEKIGPDPTIRAFGLTNLGRALLGEGRPGDAIAPLEEAVAARAAEAPAQRGESRFALARALWSRPASRPRALGLARQARADSGSDVKTVATIESWLAKPAAR